MDLFDRLMKDQRLFNRQLFKPEDSSEQAMIERLRDLVLGSMEENIELLRTFEWKPHRQRKVLQNAAYSHEQLIDMFKFWLSLADLTNFPIHRVEELYHAKSRVVRYRYQTEWLHSIDRPCVVVDIDNVLADYIRGFADWVDVTVPRTMTSERMHLVRERVRTCAEKGQWLSADSIGITPQEWLSLKHQFRSTGGKLTLPSFSDAKPFLEWCRASGWLILLITSRPIEEYPNLFTETMTWLTERGLIFDRLWWADRKADRLDLDGILLSQVRFAVDDDSTYVRQFASRGVKTYWLNRTDQPLHPGLVTPTTAPFIHPVRTLVEVIQQEQNHG